MVKSVLRLPGRPCAGILNPMHPSVAQAVDDLTRTLRILALETSGLSASVAVLDAGKVLAELKLNPQRRSAQLLAPGIRDLLGQVGWESREVNVVAVARGPGSFTGLRIGVVTAKTFAYAIGAELVAVNTLEVIADQARLEAPTPRLAVAMDAQRGEVFAASFMRSGGEGFGWQQNAAQVVDEGAWLASLVPGTAVSGPALVKLGERIPPHAILTPEDCWFPTAAGVGRLAARKHAAGQRDDLWKLAPLYLRASAAEEKRAKPLAKPPGGPASGAPG